MGRRAAIGAAVLVAALWAYPAFAATPPAFVNYQGVLRDQDDKPLTGAYDVTFRFMDAATAGNEIMIDQHATATSNAVTVSGGLFSVALGSGTVTDGSGPGTYTSLDALFRDYGSVWLEVTVGAETLGPRTQIVSAPYALNATQLGGQPAANFIDTSPTQQAKNGRLDVFASDNFGYALVGQEQATGGTGVFGYGTYIGVQGGAGDAGYGGVFSAGAWGVTGTATTGTGGHFNGGSYGVWAQGGSAYAGGAAGWFQGQGLARGILAQASDDAGRFEATSSYAPSADLAQGNVGVTGSCLAYGGYGVSGSGERAGVIGHATGTNAGGATGGTFSADGAFSVGVSGSGVTGGAFSSTASPGLSVRLADSGVGVNVNGGSFAGNFFTSTSGSTGVNASGDLTGVAGYGTGYGGNFSASGSSGIGVYGYGPDTGVRGYGGTTGGSFGVGYGASAALATAAGFGITASGPGSYGGYFSNGSPWYSYAYVPYNDIGVYAYGAAIGAQLFNFSSGAWADVSYSSYKIYGSGSVSFVQNHPTDPSKVIVYAAPEGDEVAVYTRGSGRLTNGEAHVALGETFALVANPDIGLTATVTPIGDPIPLSVVSKSTRELTVRGPAGSDAEFDYVVWGLRIGFEEQSIVQPKRRDAKIPSMHEHERFYRADPSLRRYTALARFQGVEAEVGGASNADMSRSAALRDAIGVVPYSPGPAGEGSESGAPAPSVDPPRTPPSAGAPPVAPGTAAPSSGAASAAAAAAAAPPPEGVDLMEASEPLEAGDVVSLSPSTPGAVVRSSGPRDPLVIGCVQAGDGRAGDGRLAAVATSHIGVCRVDASLGAVGVGDRLVASPVAGTAMRADAAAASGVIGRAIEPLSSGTGLVRVLLGIR